MVVRSVIASNEFPCFQIRKWEGMKEVKDRLGRFYCYISGLASLTCLAHFVNLVNKPYNIIYSHWLKPIINFLTFY